MQKEQLTKFNLWFDEYVAGFYGNDEFINANIKLKEDHSRRVCCETQYITEGLNLTVNQNLLAAAIALFHDIGRFEQFKKYRTYSDHKSIDHSKLALEVLRQQHTLNGLEENERQIIERAIEYHNVLELPAGLDGDILLQSQLIRDSDKLDIYYIVAQYYKKYEQDPEGFKLEVELSDKPGYTKNVLQKVLRGEQIDYRDLKTWNDMKLCQLSWVYDINFIPALIKIKKSRYIEIIVGFLPKDEKIQKAKEHIVSYIEKRISDNA